ncbi:hypothetical protein MTO96_009853 [Rhipicephalus appendiculatus]
MSGRCKCGHRQPRAIDVVGERRLLHRSAGGQALCLKAKRRGLDVSSKAPPLMEPGHESGAREGLVFKGCQIEHAAYRGMLLACSLPAVRF